MSNFTRLSSSSSTVYQSPPQTPPLSPMSSRMSGPNWSRPQSPTPKTADVKRHKFLRRLVKFRQMDFEYAFWQMLYLFISPQKVYRNFGYRKQTKDQWARDDPAFLVLVAFWLVVSSIGFAVVLKLSFSAFLKFLLWVIFVDYIGVGLLLASGLWWITNQYLIIQPPRGQDVEWGFCLDIHLNAFFPLLMILHLFQLPFLNAFIRNDAYLACFVGNTLWLIAVGYYIYLTFLGYSSLPFLKKTQVMLYPLTCVFIVYAISLVINWNFSKTLCNFYEYRVF